MTISTTTSGATIRYTTDGTTPSEMNGIVYSNAVNIIGTCTLQAIAYMGGMADSPITSGNYTIQITAIPNAGSGAMAESRQPGIGQRIPVNTWTDVSAAGNSASLFQQWVRQRTAGHTTNSSTASRGALYRQCAPQCGEPDRRYAVGVSCLQ